MPMADVAEFCSSIIEATADIACAYKPNLAFFEAFGEEGFAALRRILATVSKDIPVIADAKRGDIGNTARFYAKALFETYGFDATTLNVYGGVDAVEPFLKYADRGVFVWCRSSNPGAVDLQDLILSSRNRPLFLEVAELASRWNSTGNIGLVVGATYPEEMQRVREVCPDMPVLMPGVGAQGGDMEAAIRAAADRNNGGFLIAPSRQIIYASRGVDFADAARAAATSLRDEINRLRSALPRA
jgi:orotidine-5'-phosphate decarboxylase